MLNCLNKRHYLLPRHIVYSHGLFVYCHDNILMSHHIFTKLCHCNTYILQLYCQNSLWLSIAIVIVYSHGLFFFCHDNILMTRHFFCFHETWSLIAMTLVHCHENKLISGIYCHGSLSIPTTYLSIAPSNCLFPRFICHDNIVMAHHFVYFHDIFLTFVWLFVRDFLCRIN